MFPLTIAAVDKVYFEGDALSLTVPGSEGEMTVLKDHQSFVSALKAGRIIVRTNEEDREFQIEKGILEVHKGGAVVLL